MNRERVRKPVTSDATAMVLQFKSCQDEWITAEAQSKSRHEPSPTPNIGLSSEKAEVYMVGVKGKSNQTAGEDELELSECVTRQGSEGRGHCC